jgi:hypothetical protein
MQTTDQENDECEGGSGECILLDELPKCKCGGEVLYLGQESPDNWIKYWKAWFKCLICGTMFSERHEKPLRFLFSTKK